MTSQNNACLVIGISAYQAINPLPQSVTNDATDIYNILINPDYCSYPENDAQLLLNEDATAENIRQGFIQLAENTNENSTVFIYASCHGQYIDTEAYRGSYLLPVDVSFENSSEETLVNSSISTVEFTQMLRELKVKQLVVMLDCCHSGGLGQAKNINGSIIKNGLSNKSLDLMKEKGRVIFASSRENEVSIVFKGAKNSVFTTHVLKGLKGKAASLDGFIRIFELFNYIQPKVLQDSDKQHPVFKAELENNFAIAFHENYKKIAKETSNQSKEKFKYDVYISFHDDKETYFWLEKEFIPILKENELKVVTSLDTSEDPILGSNQVVSKNQGIENSKRTIMIISSKYLQNNMATFENALAQQMGIDEGRYRLIPVYNQEGGIDKSLLEGRISMLEGVDLKHPYRAERELKRLLAALKAPLNIP